MLGTIINTATIVTGSIIGSLLKRGVKEEYHSALFNALGLACLALGFNACITRMGGSEYPVLFIISLAVGSLVGTMLKLDVRLNNVVGNKMGTTWIEGLVTGTLLYCIGTLSIVGPMMSALYGDNTFLITNATLDFVTSIVLAASYGIGVIWAAPILFLWQGGIYLMTLWFGDVLSDSLIREISIGGGMLSVCTGLSILKIKDCRTVNMLPALLVPAIYFLIRSLFL
ncbi:MAG: DUF554 domain-containing protein [Bacteroidaceae bacterium]|nr:DUF554 domain-containing protein [Bacteroidaceae bacterium]